MLKFNSNATLKLHLLPYEENRQTITRGGRIKRTYNLPFDQIESESSAKRARWTIPCQAEGSGEDVITISEDVGETDIEERKDQFLRTVERLLKPSARKKHVIGREKKKNCGGESMLSTRRNGQETLDAAAKPFLAVVRLDTI